jgi:TIR domain
MSKPLVFISYAREDSEWATALARALSERSVDVWYDTMGLQAGKEWQSALVHSLRDSTVYALVVGSRTLSNPNVMFELGVASASGRPVVPIIRSSASTPELLTGLAHIQQIRTDDVQTAADELIRILSIGPLPRQKPRSVAERFRRKL